MRMQFGLSAFTRSRGDLPELPVVNMFAEQAPTEEGGVVLQSRPGLVDRAADMGAGPVQALFKADGVLDGALYGMSGSNLYRETVSLGALDGSGFASMAGYEDYLFANKGGSVWSYDGATLAAIAFPDGANVKKILVGASRLICLRSDTQTFYWSTALATTVGALDFAAAENQPDRLRDMLFIKDALVLGGAETVEFWPNTNDSELPFQPLEGAGWRVGVKNTGAMCLYGTTFAVVTSENRVALGDQENVVSAPGLEALIEASANAYLFSFLVDGSELLCLRLDSGTWVFNRRSGTFSTFETWGNDTWTPSCFDGGVFGSSVDGTTFAFSGHVDEGGVLERRFRAGFPLNGGSVPINSISLRCNVGQTSYLTGTYTDPIVEMRLSRDGGKTWGEWRPKTLGTQANYRKLVRWNNCGQASHPGLLAEFRVTAPVDWRVSDVLLNEPRGGR